MNNSVYLQSLWRFNSTYMYIDKLNTSKLVCIRVEEENLSIDIVNKNRKL